MPATLLNSSTLERQQEIDQLNLMLEDETPEWDLGELRDLPGDIVMPVVPGITWRDYQEEVFHDVFDAFQRDYRRLYYKMTVAGGKTLTSGSVASIFLRDGAKVLWLAHNGKLLRQAETAFTRLGYPMLWEKANKTALGGFITGESNLVLGSLQTLRDERLWEWPRDSFDLIVFDECQFSLAPKNVEIIRYFNAARLLGMTGTDDRGDDKNLGSIFQMRILSLNLAEATERKMTTPIIRNKIHVEPPIDLRGLKKVKGEFNDKELSPIIQKNAELICSAVAQERYEKNGIGDRPTMAFCPDINSSEVIAETLTRFGITAKALHSKMPDRPREIGEREFESGKFQVLVNPLAYTVGTDFPFVSALMLLRPIGVRSLLEQIVGRGVRLPDDNPLSKGKENCLILDFPWLIGDQHKLVHVSDVFDDGSLSEPVKDRVRRIMDEKDVTVQEAMEQAEAEEEIYRIRLDHIDFQKREVFVRSMAHDPLATFEVIGLKRETPREKRAKEQGEWQPPSDYLKAELRKWKQPGIDRLNFAQAQRLLNALIRRRNKGLCSAAQARYLLRLGASAETVANIKFKDASAAINKLKKEKGIA